MITETKTYKTSDISGVKLAYIISILTVYGFAVKSHN